MATITRAASISDRENTLKLDKAKPTLGIFQVHASKKGDYKAYVTERRGVMLQYYAALYDPKKGDPASFAKALSALDAGMKTPAKTPESNAALMARACADPSLTEYDRMSCGLPAKKTEPVMEAAVAEHAKHPKAAKNGFFSTLWSSVKKGDLSPSSSFGQYVSHGTFHGSSVIQDEAKMTQIQNGILMTTAGAVVAIGTGGTALPALASALGSVGVTGTAATVASGSGAAIVGGMGFRATTGTLAGKKAGTVVGEVFDPKSIVVDGALGAVFSGVALVAKAIRPTAIAAGATLSADAKVAAQAKATLAVPAAAPAELAAQSQAALARLDASAAARDAADAQLGAQSKEALARLEASAAARDAANAQLAAKSKEALARLDARDAAPISRTPDTSAIDANWGSTAIKPGPLSRTPDTSAIDANWEASRRSLTSRTSLSSGAMAKTPAKATIPAAKAGPEPELHTPSKHAGGWKPAAKPAKPRVAAPSQRSLTSRTSLSSGAMEQAPVKASLPAAKGPAPVAHTPSKHAGGWNH